MFEASHTEQSSAPPEAVWALWIDPARWPEWNTQVEWGEIEGEPAPGAAVTVKFKHGGRMRFEITQLEPQRLLVDEARLPGCRFGHEHRVEPSGAGSEITHRLYLKGPTAKAFALLFGRRKLKRSVTDFVAKERALAE